MRACARHAIGLNGATNHMANLHWVIETIRAAMDRTLPETHPIHRLVYPFTGYVSILNAVTRLPGVLPFRLALEVSAGYAITCLGGKLWLAPGPNRSRR